MPYSWVSCDLETGNVLADLPDLAVDSVKQTVGRYETASATLPLPTAPENWVRATMEGATVMVLLWQPLDTNGGFAGQPIPVWGGMVVKHTRDETDVISLSLATLEYYMDARFTGAKTYTATGQNSIVSDLVTTRIGAGVNGGLPIRVQVVTAGAGTARDRTYLDQDDKTVYSALTDLMSVQGGPEWYIGWEHQASPERYTPVFYVGDRIGTPVGAGMSPNATFEMPGPVMSFQMVRDFSTGKGANSVVATSSGQGTTRPQSPASVYVDPVRPTFEYRWTPSTSILNVATLVSWASKAITQLDTGTITLALSAMADFAPALGSDWFLGDDIGYNIGGIDQNGDDLVPAFPGGISGVGRAIGYEFTLTETPVITPVLYGGSII